MQTIKRDRHKFVHQFLLFTKSKKKRIEDKKKM